MKSKTKYKMITLAILIVLIICWRQSYFILTPRLDKLNFTGYSKLDTTMRVILKTRDEKEKEYEESLTPEERKKKWEVDKAAASIHHKPDSAWINRIRGPFVAIPFLEIIEKKRTIYKGQPFMYKSLEYGWQRTFDSYYKSGGVIAYNNDNLTFLFRRGPAFRLFETVSGAMVPIRDMSSPPIYIYLFFNTAKIGWNEVYIVDRKTGKIKEKYRIDAEYNIWKASLLPDNKLYIRTGNRVYIHQLP